MDVVNRVVKAFYREVDFEPDRRVVTVADSVVPYEYQYSFDEYLRVYDHIMRTHTTIKIWDAYLSNCHLKELCQHERNFKVCRFLYHLQSHNQPMI